MIIILTSLVTFATFFFLAFLVDRHVQFVVLVLQIITTIYDLITYPIYLFIDKPWAVKRLTTTEYSDRHYEPNGDYTYWEIKPEMSAKRQAKYSYLEDRMDKVTHLSEYLSIAQELYADTDSIGQRRVLRKVNENGKNKYELSDYEWITYREVQKTIDCLTNVFHHKFEFKRGDRVAIMADTCFEWFAMFFALQCLGCEVATLPATLGEDGIAFILNSTKVEYVFTQTDLVRLMNKLKPKIQTVKKLIYIENPFTNQLTNEEIESSPYEIYELNKLMKENQKLPAMNLNNNSEYSINDVAIIMFTSGSTGDPKGVYISHYNILQSAKGVMQRVHFAFEVDNSDTFLAYLPMSHIFEMMCEITFYLTGLKMAFGRPATITTGAPLLARGCIGDVQASKLTVWTGVPLIFERVQSRIQGLLRSKSPYVAGVYDWAYSYKKNWTNKGFRCRLIDTIFFKFIKDQFGGRLRMIVAGGAPLLLETQIFLKTFFNAKLLLGYSSTECTANGCIAIYDEFDSGNVLYLMEGVKLRLEDWVEGGYSIHDKPNARGEVILGTHAASIGYFENEEETKKSFFEENGIRWWRSGDIGEVNHYGHLQIIDRKKDLVKLAMGEYIALGKAEAVLKMCTYVDNIVLHGCSFHNHLIAIVQINQENLIKLAESMAKDTSDIVKLCQDPVINKAVLEDLQKYGRSNGLMGKEVPYVIGLYQEAWTPNNGLLTASLKTRRTQIYAHYKAEIERMYGELESKFSN